MNENIKDQNALSAKAAYNLADICKSPPQYQSISPRWITRLIEWKALNTGVFRLNRVIEGRTALDTLCVRTGNDDIPEGYIDYDAEPREYILGSISAVVKINTRVSDVYNGPFDQIGEQMRLCIESIKERQEHLLLHSDDYGLLKNAAAPQRIKPRQGAPTPDDLDELITKVWKEPSFFLAHPRAIAAFGRECTRRGVPPVAVTLFDSPFISWRGIPIVPTDKLPIRESGNAPGGSCKTDILLIRSGEDRRGVLGLYQDGLPEQRSRGLSVRFMGIDQKGIGLYLISLYCSLAILADDAVGVLEDADVNCYE